MLVIVKVGSDKHLRMVDAPNVIEGMNNVRDELKLDPKTYTLGRPATPDEVRHIALFRATNTAH